MTETLTTTMTYDADQADFDANAAYWSGQAAAAKAQQEAVKKLLALKGQTLTVVKGKKVPHGTTGVCFYSGEGKWGWRVGFTTADGDTVWTDVNNVTAAEPARANGNTVREDGVDRCPCGCKYWEYDCCIDCGGTDVL